jgi:hypothetical protein
MVATLRDNLVEVPAWAGHRTAWNFGAGAGKTMAGRSGYRHRQQADRYSLHGHFLRINARSLPRKFHVQLQNCHLFQSHKFIFPLYIHRP